MTVDGPILMVAAGAFSAAAWCLFAVRKRGRPILFTALMWCLFGAGLAVRSFAPNLPIQRRQFVLPSAHLETIRVNELVERERRMQLLAAVLTGISCLGLALCYRHTLASYTRKQA